MRFSSILRLYYKGYQKIRIYKKIIKSKKKIKILELLNTKFKLIN